MPHTELDARKAEPWALGRALLSLLILTRLLSADGAEEWLPGFQMDPFMDQARLIVRGALQENGEFTVQEVVAGPAAQEKITIPNGAAIYGELQAALGTPPGAPVEAIAFLGAENRPVLGSAGLVGVVKGSAHVRQPRSSRRSATRPEYFTVPSGDFLAAVREALALVQERERLLALSPSTERAEAAMAFLLGLGQRGWEGSSIRYHVARIAKQLAPPSTEEETAILDALAQNDEAPRRVLLLDLAGRIPLTRNALDSVAELLGRGQVTEVRRQAVQAVVRIGGSQALEFLRPYLVPDEPELSYILGLFGGVCRPHGQERWNSDAVDALVRLARTCLAHDQTGAPPVLPSAGHGLLSELRYCAHPRSVGVLCSWAFDEDVAMADLALGTLKGISGLSLSREEKDAWAEWRAAVQPVLTKVYRLSEPEGLQAWCDAYGQADAATRRLLMRLWLFEPTINEDALSALSAGTSPERAALAKAVLSELWENGRLSPAHRKALILRHLNPKLIELPGFRGGRHELQIATERDFPFPKNAWVSYRGVWRVGRGTFGGGGWSSRSLRSDDTALYLGSYGGGAHGGTAAEVVLELCEHNHAHGGEVVWSHRWSLGPIQLRDENVPGGE